MVQSWVFGKADQKQIGESRLVTPNKASPAFFFKTKSFTRGAFECLDRRKPFLSQCIPQVEVRGNVQTSGSARRRWPMEISSFSPSAVFFAAPCKFCSWLPIALRVLGRQRFQEAITGQEFLSAHFCRVMHANWFMPTSLANLLSHIMRSLRRRVSVLRPSVVPARTGTAGWHWWDANGNAAALPSRVCRIGKCRSSPWAIAHVVDSTRAVFPSQQGFLR